MISTDLELGISKDGQNKHNGMMSKRGKQIDRYRGWLVGDSSILACEGGMDISFHKGHERGGL